MDLGLGHKVALVAAASQGLGKAAARSLAQEGASLVICARGKETLESTANELRNETGAEIEAIAADLTDAAAIDAVVKGAQQRFGRIDILVNNAGGPPTGTITGLSDEAWEKGFTLTMKSMIRLTRAVLPPMEERGWGRIITIASITAKQPVDDLLISSTLRPGILGLTKVLANQYGRYGITVNTVCPGYILTARQEELSRSRSAERRMTMEEYLKDSARQIPVGRLGRPDEIGDVIAFLASERASFINGANIMADGGQARSIL